MSIQVPGQRPENPLLTLAHAVEKATAELHQIAVNTGHAPAHQYAIAQGKDGTWGSFCVACSDELLDYIYPCMRHPELPRPPIRVVASPNHIDS